MTKKEKGTAAAPTNSPTSRSHYNKHQTINQHDSGIPMPEPWPEPVDGTELIVSLRQVFTRHLSLSDGVAELLPYWVLHTYNPELFYFTPRLCIYSPVPRCGKSQLLQLLEMTSFQPLNVSNITSAGIFRAIDALHPTMLIDEADTYMNGNSEIRGVINAGFKRGGNIMRNVETKGNYIPRQFNCFAPMAIAGIGMRDDTIMDRSIVVVMRRRKLVECIEKLRPGALEPHTEQLRAKCMRFMADNAAAIAQIVPQMPQFLNDRAADIWEPLFSIAMAISPDHVSELTYAAARLAPPTDNDDAETRAIQLLADIHHAFAEMDCDFIATEVLLRHLYRLENRPWGEKQYGQIALNSIKLAAMLRDFQIRPVQVRQGKQIQRGYELAAFADAFDRYLPPESRDSVTTQSPLGAECNGVTDCPTGTPTPAQETPVAAHAPVTDAPNYPPMNSPEWQAQYEQALQEREEPDWEQVPENLLL